MKISRKLLVEFDKKYIWHPFTNYDEWKNEDILIIDRGKGNYLFDLNGKKYLDANGALWCNLLGHNNPALNNQVSRQLKKVAHSTFLGSTHTPAIELSQKLIDLLPDNNYKVFYSNSGSESVEVAIKICYQYFQLKNRNSNQDIVVSLKNDYHGDTLGAVSVGGIDIFHKTFKKLLFKTIQTDSPYLYRCKLQCKTHEECSEHCIRSFDNILKKFHKRICAIIVEPVVQCAAGFITQPKGFLNSIWTIARKHQIPFIVDEVATGFYRTGTLFAFEQEQIKPDIIILGKSITGGYLPLSCAIINKKLSSVFSGSFERTFFHGHTYTANPLACSAAIATLNEINKKSVAESLKAGISALRYQMEKARNFNFVGDVRSRGLIGGIEIVKNKPTKEPFDPKLRLGRKVCLTLRNFGIITRPLGDVIVFFPSILISPNEISRFFRSLETSLENLKT
ncbi:MAG: adenosylmethionine--8-amino-7-oxononanoate transaminase [Planctomycetes bacterium]|nr:adenosylmethionine--8-amino-7-oxononanoate transaminase [Planctomycetota bacterium]